MTFPVHFFMPKILKKAQQDFVLIHTLHVDLSIARPSLTNNYQPFVISGTTFLKKNFAIS